ncbi:MAG: HemK2/MTQ2 family protein methyltransferase [Candidatus Nanoarchaeia archaeon]
MTYEPAEDTYLLLNIIKTQLQKNSINKTINICEIGCGSGEIITTLAQEFPEHLYFATDINPQAIEDTNQLAKEKNVQVEVKKGSFLHPFPNQQFDIILFNTPYLPCEEGERFDKLNIEEKALYGGTCGFEVTTQFIDSLHSYIHQNSQIYILISTLTQQNIVEQCLKNNAFNFEIIVKQSQFFEELLVYQISPSPLLQHLVSKQYQDIQRFDKGRHSYILQAQHPITHKKLMIKFGKSQHIEKEVKFLQKLQDTNYAPHIIEHSREYVIYEKIEGITIEEFFKRVNQQEYSMQEIEVVINRCFAICFDLDIRGICKDELTHPNEHIFINPDQLEDIFFIDFERSVFSNKRANSTQFLQYILRNSQILKIVGIKISRTQCIEVGKHIMRRNSPITLKDLTI